MANSSADTSDIRAGLEATGRAPQGAAERRPMRRFRLPAVASGLFRSRVATVGLVLILFWVVVALAAPIIAPFDPADMVSMPLESPSVAHWLGTDHLGRDVLSRLMWGTRVVLVLAPAATLIGVALGICLGLISGYMGGLVDTLIMRACDIVISFPVLLIYILIIASIGPSAVNVVVAVAVGAIPAVTRIVRSLVMSERTQDYVGAARLRGEGRWYIMLHEILPNVAGPIIVDACIRVGYAIIAIGSLGFLGLGMPPPTPDWGRMINEGRRSMLMMPWAVLAPAAALSSLVVALNLLSDGIKEAAQQR